MANALNGINLAKIANRSLDYMKREFISLRSFHRDFSQEIAAQGASITTRIPTSVSAVDVTNGYTPQDVGTTPVTITLDQNPGFPYALKDNEVYKAANDFDWLMQIFVVPATEAVLKAFFDYSLALVTAANFPNALIKSPAQFDADAIADAGISLSMLNVSKKERAAILLPTYTGNIAKDSTVENLASSGSTEALRDLTVSRCRGFEINEYTGIPNNGEQLAGVCLHPSALCMAARPQVTPKEFIGRIENVIEPVTGLPLQWRMWYDANNKRQMISVEALFGVSKGNSNALLRIPSA